MAARKLFPMPVDGLFSHPDWIALPVAGRGMLMSLCEHFWRTDCRPLPRDDDQLFAVSRAHRPTWRHHKATILAIFADIRPALETYHHTRRDKKDQLRIASSRGGQTKASRQKLSLIRESQPDSLISHAFTIGTPNREAEQKAKPTRTHVDPPKPGRKRMTDRRVA